MYNNILISYIITNKEIEKKIILTNSVVYLKKNIMLAVFNFIYLNKLKAFSKKKIYSTRLFSQLDDFHVS